jgi:hypothetical protein
MIKCFRHGGDLDIMADYSNNGLNGCCARRASSSGSRRRKMDS